MDFYTDELRDNDIFPCCQNYELQQDDGGTWYCVTCGQDYLGDPSDLAKAHKNAVHN